MQTQTLAVVLAVVIGASLFGCASHLPAPQTASEPAPDTSPPLEQRTSTEPEPMPAEVQAWLHEPPPAMHTGHLALLLPLSGPYASTAEAVRDGFLSRHFDSGHDGEIRIYDVGDSPQTLLSAYQHALDLGAGFIVGPLKKESVAQLAMLQPPVPVLGLNYLDPGAVVPFNFYQLGLAPEDEARAAADDALRKNLRRAVVLVPEGDWGTRVLAAFEDQLQQGGGHIIDVARYRQGVSDQSESIARLMGMTESEERHRALTSVLGTRTVFEARRRGDIDVVFLGARSQDARVLLPQFRFYRAGGLPHYATALAYDGKPDPELTGLRFCDIPFMLDAQGVWAQERALAARLPAAAAYPRLYALGRDAYDLAVALQRGFLRVGDGYTGAIGRLEWIGSSVLARRLDCAELRASGLVPTALP
ncbi:penicillin-binding protein activator [Fontimonas thermophila]|nr:penicillin-binding protein activator [Fontimonas thermophila]